MLMRHLVNAYEVKAHLIGCWQNLGTVCFWQPIPTGLNLVVAAVLRNSLVCSCHCCSAWQTVIIMLYTVCKVEQFVLN